jgi:hypothetical protein
MQQDIKEKLNNFKTSEIKLSDNHSAKFEALLNKEMHQKKNKKNTLKWLSIAASIVLLVSLTIQFYPSKNIEQNLNNTDNSAPKKQITLGNISPEFNIIETYYVNSIKLEISDLDLSEDNKEIVDDYLLKIAKLTQEYKNLTTELNTNGVNDATIDALIGNLQLRLQLLQRLKKQLHELKNLNTKQNETQII